MLEVLSAPHHVAAFHFVDMLNARDYTLVQAEVEARLARHARIGVYADVTGMRGITPVALYRDLRYGLGKIAEWDRFPRGAVVSDNRYVRTAVDLVGRLVPQVQMHTFSTAQRADAMAWAAELPEVPVETKATRFIETTRQDTYALAWNGKLRARDMKQAIDVLAPAFAAHDKLRLLLRIEDYGGVEPQVFVQSGFVALKLAGWRKLERYALVGGPSWIVRYLDVAKHLVPFDIRHFEKHEEQAAWHWLEAEPVTPASGAGGQEVRA